MFCKIGWIGFLQKIFLHSSQKSIQKFVHSVLHFLSSIKLGENDEGELCDQSIRFPSSRKRLIHFMLEAIVRYEARINPFPELLAQPCVLEQVQAENGQVNRGGGREKGWVFLAIAIDRLERTIKFSFHRPTLPRSHATRARASCLLVITKNGNLRGC